MLNPNERNINLNWHNLREEDAYEEAIKTIQKITITTSIGNIYWYTRAIMADYPYYPNGPEDPVLWEVSKNWEPLYRDVEDPNDPGQIITVRVLEDITVLEPVLAAFYNVFEPGTLIPIEVPVKVVLN